MHYQCQKYQRISSVGVSNRSRIDSGVTGGRVICFKLQMVEQIFWEGAFSGIVFLVPCCDSMYYWL